MKKIFTVLSVLAIAGSLSAQTSKVSHYPVKSNLTSKVTSQSDDRLATIFKAPVNPKGNTESTSAINPIKMGYSLNPFSVLIETQTCMFYQPDLNLLAFTHRQAPGGAGGSGILTITNSVNSGATWDSTLRMTQGVGGNRYPSGVIYNPAGNTTVANAVAVGVGPSLNDSNGVNVGAWTSHFFFSSKMDGTNKNAQWKAYSATPFNETNANLSKGLTVDNQGRVRAIGYTLDTATSTTYTGAFVLTGTWNAGTNKFDISFKEIPAPNMDYYGSTLSMAWNKSGTVGYVTAMGTDTTAIAAQKKPVPHVWKTVDAGTTWTKMPFYNFGSIPAFVDSLRPMTTGGVRPFLVSTFGLDAVVDYQDNLHLIYAVASAYSDHPDSIDYTWNFASGRHLYDLYTTSTGWNAKHMYKFATDEVADDATSPIGLAYTARIHAGTSSDGKKVFASWTDSDPALTPTLTNDLPDIFVGAWDVESGKTAMWLDGGTYKKYNNMTLGSNIEGACYYKFMARNVGKTGTMYNMHISYSKPDGNDPGNLAVTHFYVDGIDIDETAFRYPTAVNDIKRANFSVSQNFPNPSNGVTSINVNLVKSATVNLQVTNVIGQTVYSKTFNGLSEGANRLDLNLDVKAGAYFYQVSVDGVTVTNKMLVK